MINNLATLVYTKAIEDRLKSKYLKRIDYLVCANNELIQELEHYETLCEKLNFENNLKVIWEKDIL